MLQKLKNIDNTWFFSRPPFWMRLFSIYVKGDSLVIVPMWMMLFISLFFKASYGVVGIVIFLFLRSFIEMIYWIFQQFSSRQYRPSDFDFPNLDNHAIYIIFQLINLLYSTIYATLLVFLIKNI